MDGHRYPKADDESGIEAVFDARAAFIEDVNPPRESRAEIEADWRDLCFALGNFPGVRDLVCELTDARLRALDRLELVKRAHAQIGDLSAQLAEGTEEKKRVDEVNVGLRDELADEFTIEALNRRFDLPETVIRYHLKKLFDVGRGDRLPLASIQEEADKKKAYRKLGKVREKRDAKKKVGL